MTQEPSQMQKISADFFFVTAIISGILAFVLFSGFFRPEFPINPWLELFTVILSVAMIMAGVCDLAVNHAGVEIADLLAVIFVIIAIAEVVVNVYVFDLTNYGVTHHISPTDFPLGVVLAGALILFAIVDYAISHS